MHALQLEMAQACYMDEAQSARASMRARAAPLVDVLERLVVALRRMAAGGSRAMIRFYVARQRYDAYLVADRLNQAGIRAHVFNEHASSIVGDVPPDVAQPQVWIADDNDEPRARALLRADGDRRYANNAPLLPQVRRAVARQLRALLELRLRVGLTQLDCAAPMNGCTAEPMSMS